MLRIGILSELGSGENLGYARVDFDEVGAVSAWLPLPSTATKTAKQWIPIEVGSQVACLMDDECEQGVISIVLWSMEDTPPDFANDKTIGMQFADGSILYYDNENHKLIIDISNGNIEINGGKNDGLVLIKELLKKINQLEDKLKNHQHSYINAVGTPTLTTPAIALGDTTLIFNNTQQSEIENDKIKQ